MNIRNIFLTLFAIGTFASISLPASDTCKRLDNGNFESIIADGTVVVDFYADWCPPCQKLGPIFEQAASQMGDGMTFAKANVDVATKASQKYNVASIPTLILFKDGKEIKRRMGGCDMKTLQNFIKQNN